MLDSSAKLPSGLLNGNVNQLGDFDQCLDVADSVEKIKGQYCLASLQPEVPEKFHRMKYLHELLQSHSAFRSEFNDVSTYANIYKQISHSVFWRDFLALARCDLDRKSHLNTKKLMTNNKIRA